MYFAVSKFRFEEPLPMRDLHALVKKVQSRFPVCVRSCQDHGDQGSAFVVASLGERETGLSQQLDAIAAFVEGCGYGRIASEDVLFDHVDNLGSATRA